MWETLTSRPASDDVLNTFAIVSALIFGIVFLLSAVYSARPWMSPVGQTYSRRFVQRAGMVLGWISGIGLFFLLIRLLQIDPATLGRPIWIALTLLALVAAVVWLVPQAASDRETRQRNRAGHRPSQLSRRPAKRIRS